MSARTRKKKPHPIVKLRARLRAEDAQAGRKPTKWLMSSEVRRMFRSEFYRLLIRAARMHREGRMLLIDAKSVEEFKQRMEQRDQRTVEARKRRARALHESVA